MAEKTRVYEELMELIEEMYHAYEACVPLWQYIKERCLKEYNVTITEDDAFLSAIETVWHLAGDLAKLTQYWDDGEREAFLRRFISLTGPYREWDK